jgi:hypothetical protein
LYASRATVGLIFFLRGFSLLLLLRLLDR